MDISIRQIGEEELVEYDLIDPETGKPTGEKGTKPHKRAGYWTFLIDGKESLFYSSNEDGIHRKVLRLLSPPKGIVGLHAIAASAKRTGDEPGTANGAENTREATTRAHRLAAFFARGKLADTKTIDDLKQ